MKKRIVGIVCVVVLMSAAVSRAQSVELKGHVQDQTTAVIANADVQIKSAGKGIAHIATNRSGDFSFQAEEGTYTVIITAAGFKTIDRDESFVAGKANLYVPAIDPEAAWGGSRDVRDPINSTPVVLQTMVAPAVSPVQKIASRQAWEYGALAQGGVGLTENRDSFRFLMAGVHAGRVLTNNSGHHIWSGQFEYAMEFFPYWQSFTPSFQRANCYPVPTTGATQVGVGLYCTNDFETGGTYTGTTITPIILRWNFTHGKRFMPWAQAAGGLLWTNHKYPSFGSPQLSLGADGPATETSVFNFTPQGGIGFHYFMDDRHSIDFSANGVHISSASLGDKNPGINASVQFSLGYTWWK